MAQQDRQTALAGTATKNKTLTEKINREIYTDQALHPFPQFRQGNWSVQVLLSIAASRLVPRGGCHSLGGGSCFWQNRPFYLLTIQ